MTDQNEIKDIYQYLLDTAGYPEDIRYLHSSLPHWYPYFIKRLFKIEVFVNNVLHSGASGYVLQERTIGRGELAPKKTYLVPLKLAAYFKSMWEFLTTYHDGYRYSPKVDIFFQSCIEMKLEREAFTNPRSESSILGKYQFEIFNELIDRIRRSADTPEFKAKKKAILDKFNRRHREYSEYIDGLFRKHARLLVLRVDLSYEKEHAALVTAEQAKADFNRFIHRFRRNRHMYQDCVGYIWKLEFGAEKGYHYHCFFFYNEQKVKSDYSWGKRIGEYWKSTVQHGHYWNCNTTQHKADFEKHGKLGIGKIHRNDFKLRDNLNVILRYLIKSEQYLLAMSLANEPRLIGRGL